MNNVLLAAAIVGAVSTIKHAFGDGKITGITTIAIALVLGLVAGFGGVDGLTPYTGVLIGLASVGGATLADRISVTQ